QIVARQREVAQDAVTILDFLVWIRMQLGSQMRWVLSGKLLSAERILHHIRRLNCINSVEDLVIDHHRRSFVTTSQTGNLADTYLSFAITSQALLKIGSQSTGFSNMA